MAEFTVTCVEQERWWREDLAPVTADSAVDALRVVERERIRDGRRRDLSDNIWQWDEVRYAVSRDVDEDSGVGFIAWREIVNGTDLGGAADLLWYVERV